MPTMTAARRRELDRIEYDAFLADCPSRQVLDRLSSKWVALVLCALATGPKRHGELGRQIAGVSQKMLTQTLRELERDGLITRTVTPTVPLRVDYQLTELGADLQRITEQIKHWAESNMTSIIEAREHYDAV
jgi:DNA-binding HxlR family transcriptional regulator